MQRKSRGSSLAPSTLVPWELLSCWEGKGELFALEQNLLHKVVLVRVRGKHLIRCRFDLKGWLAIAKLKPLSLSISPLSMPKKEERDVLGGI